MVSIARQMCETALPDPACRPAAVAAVPRLPIATPLGQIAPRPTGPVAGKPGLDTQTMVFRSPLRKKST
jgi:hypothetical protein